MGKNILTVLMCIVVCVLSVFMVKKGIMGGDTTILFSGIILFMPTVVILSVTFVYLVNVVLLKIFTRQGKLKDILKRFNRWFLGESQQVEEEYEDISDENDKNFFVVPKFSKLGRVITQQIEQYKNIWEV